MKLMKKGNVKKDLCFSCGHFHGWKHGWVNPYKVCGKSKKEKPIFCNRFVCKHYVELLTN